MTSSSNSSSDSKCIFCRIVAGELPAKKVYEDDEFLAFDDISPSAPVHVLIIPKKHIVSLLKITAQDTALLGRLLALAPRIANKKGCGSDSPNGGGFRLLCNTGPQGGQEVPHLHLHVIAGGVVGGSEGCAASE
jgi:histidine triad (HIT) family protein